MLKSEIVNRDDQRARQKRRRGVLNVKYIGGIAPQFPRKSQRNADQRRVRRRPFYLEIGPTTGKPIDGGAFRDVEGVLISLIDPGERFDQIDSVGFVSAQLGSDGMRVDRDVQDRIIFHFSFFIFHFDIHALSYE